MNIIIQREVYYNICSNIFYLNISVWIYKGSVFMVQEVDLGIDYKAVGARLRTARLNKNIKQEEIADILNTTQGFISTMETGYKKPSLTTLIKLCRIYEVSFDYILLDNLPHLKQSLNPDFDEILSDCNEKERVFLLLLLKEAKLLARQQFSR